MGTLLVRNAAVLVTMDGKGTEIEDGGMFIRDGWIEKTDIGPRLPKTADSVVDLSNCVVLPGFINGHHHLYQTLDRACVASQSANLIGWLNGLYPRWAKLTPDDVRLAMEIGLAELALSGCTTVADHHYLWVNGNVAEDHLEVAARVGIRFHLGRGFQNIGQTNGGFAPDSLTEKDDNILADCDRVVSRFHDPTPGALMRIFIAPGSVRTVTPDLLRESAQMARDLDVGFHMHLGETASEIDFVRERSGCRPAELAESLGCVGENTWFAHAVHLNREDVKVLCNHRCGICHCPSSNMRLASGIAPIQQYRKQGLKVGLGVDGSASNDSSNLFAELRLALLLSRVNVKAPDALLEPRAALEMATAGGARLLGRDDIGRLTPGCVADFIAIKLDRIEMLGAEDPVAAIALCALNRVDHSWVNGRSLVADGMLRSVDIAALAERVRRRAVN
jgi:8-oxoguanine deaminase